MEKTAVRDQLAALAVQEAGGTGGSGRANLGPIYRAKKAEADQSQAELTALLATSLPQIQQKEQHIATLQTTVQTEIAGLQRSRYDGMAARMEALSRLTSNSRAILLASLFITLLFVAIETSPILVKLISYRGPYDYLLYEHEHVFEMANLEQVSQLSNRIRHQVKYDTETGAYLVQARIVAEKALIDHKLKARPYDWGNAHL